MKFRTEIEITSLGVKIGYENRVLALGSCFAAHIARKLAGAKFRVAENPSGILFNPLSIAAAIRSYADPAPVTRGELGFDGEVWHHFGFHGDLSSPTAEEALARMNAARQAGAEALRTADRVLLTFGTAWVYEHDGEVVANCHRRPAAEFSRRRLSVEEIAETFAELLEGPLAGKQIILTVSPVRHVGDTLPGNAGDDLFVLSTTTTSTDTDNTATSIITDFGNGQDTLKIGALGAGLTAYTEDPTSYKSLSDLLAAADSG